MHCIVCIAFYALCSVHCIPALYYMHCILCIVLYALYPMNFIRCIVFYALYSMHCIPFSVFYALFSMHCILCIVFYALYSMHCMLCFALYTLYTLYYTLYAFSSMYFILCIANCWTLKLIADWPTIDRYCHIHFFKRYHWVLKLLIWVLRGWGEIFEGDFADMCPEQFLLMSMGGRAEGLACSDPGSRTSIGLSGNCFIKKDLSTQKKDVKTLIILFIPSP
jgi:hypothetical protein